MPCLCTVALVVLSCLCTPLLSAGPALAQTARNWRKESVDIQAHNAARIDNGGRIALRLVGEGAGKDRNTMPEALMDGSARSRCVTWGVPIVYRIELVARLPVTHVNFICSNQAGESPKDVEVCLSDGTVIEHTLESLQEWKSPRDAQRQRVDVGRDVEWVEVKVLSVHPGPVNAAGDRVTYGGLGEIEVITSADLKPYLTVADYNPGAPAYVEGGSPRSDYSNVEVHMPEAIPLGERPGIYMTHADIVKLQEEMKKGPRTGTMLEKLFAACDEWTRKDIAPPDPTAPAQVRDRNDAQARAHFMMSKMAGWLGWAWQLTGDEKYAETARKILVGYAGLYPADYKEHKGVNAHDTAKVMAQRLSEAEWLLPLIQGYDLTYNATCMTDADRKLIEKDLIRCALTFIQSKRSAADEVARRDRENPDWRTAVPAKSRGAVGNWTNFYNAAYIQGGIVLGDRDWIDIGMSNTRSNLHMGIGDDGMWGEGSIGYQLHARNALVACIEPLARKGIDLYGFAGCRFKNLFDSPMKLAYPDGTAPGINDAGRAAAGGSWTAMVYDYAWLSYRDPNYGKAVNDAPRQLFQSQAIYYPTVIYTPLPETEIRGFGSLVFDSQGYAVLRGTDGGGQTFLLMDYGPHGGTHGHPDKLNLILFADGDELAGEPQGYRYEDRRHLEWTRPTIGHWTLSVDMNQQAPHTGKLLGFYDAGDVKIMRGTSDGAYAGVALDRTVVQMPGYVADVYRAWGPARHTFDYPLCFRGAMDRLKGVDPATLKPIGAPSQRGYKHIMAGEPTTTDANWSATWARPAVTAEPDQGPGESAPNDDRRTHPAGEVKAIVLGAPGTTVYTGTVPGGRHQAVIRREGKEAVFAAVIDPYRAGDAVKSVERFKIEGPVPAYGLKVTRTDGGTDLIIVRWDQQTGGKPAGPSTGEEVTTNALVSVVRLDASGKVLDMGLLGGTELTAAGKSLSLDAPGITRKD